MKSALVAVYLLSALGLALFGMLGYWTLALRRRYRDWRAPEGAFDPSSAPRVTVQLPVYNEPGVVEGLIDAAAGLDYPRDRLQIQVLDDSTDETTAKASRRVEFHRRAGIDVQLLHRDRRTGFKAGALQSGMATAGGEFVAVFDADFRPPPDFLRRTIPHLLGNLRVGLVQTRWEHLNADQSILTAAQAIALDKHFALDQFVRFQGRLFPKFNGSAGVWRRRCLEQAGGWDGDTLCEDLCVSIRAALAGWEFLFLPEVTAAAELPRRLRDFKDQQSRWAQGSTQCLLKYAPSMLRTPRFPWFAKLYALLTMSGYMTSWMLLCLLLSLVPLVWLDHRFPPALILLGVAGLGQPLSFVQSQLLLRDWKRTLPYLPALLLASVSVAPSLARGVFKGLMGRPSPFVRTPKGGFAEAPGSHRNWIRALELVAGLYALAGVVICILRSNPAPLGFFLICCCGFFWAFAEGSRRETQNKAGILAVVRQKPAGGQPETS